MKYLSMFSGVGGFELGIKQSDPSSACVGYSEVDKYAKEVYKRHFPDHTGLGDATRIKTERIPDYEVLIGGFPCQPFSVAGKGGGMCDTRGTLFYELERVLRDTRPRYFLFENVRGLLSNKEGETYQKMLKILTDMGYIVEWALLNSEDYGVPQHRERIFITGHLRTECRREVFFKRRTDKKDTGKGGLKEITRGLSDANRIYDSTGSAKTIKSLGGGLGAKTGLYLVPCPIRFLNRNQKNFKDVAMTVDTSNSTGVTDGYRVRRLTPKECERLQGFPDDWTKHGASGKLMSDTQRYKMTGNAVTVSVVKWLWSRLLELDTHRGDKVETGNTEVP